jgi:ferritin-like metal-binding protein YciE
MFNKVDSPMELLVNKLEAAMTMEHTVLKMLGELEEEARHEELKQLFHHHAEETQQQIRNLEQAFVAVGREPDKRLSPTITALRAEGKANIELAKDEFVDDVILAAAAETEHHEIAVYEELITYAEAMGRHDVAALLRQNLEQEQHTLEEVRRAAERVAEETLQPA